MSRRTLAAAVAGQVAQLRRTLDDALRADARGVHQARVATRRLREAIGVFRVIDDARGVGRTARRLRDLSRGLGGVRECDVALETLRAEAADHGWPREIVDIVAADLERLRGVRRRSLVRLSRKIEPAAVARDLLALRDVLGAPGVPARLRDAAAGRRRRRAQVFGDDLARLSRVYSPDDLHAARISGKKLRYAMEWERDAGVRAWVRERARLESAQDVLGGWHDVLALQEHLHRLRRRGDLPRTVGRGVKAMAADLDRRCRADHARILAEVPGLRRLAQRAGGR